MCKQFEVTPCSLFTIGYCSMSSRAAHCAFGTGIPSIEVAARKLSLTS
jgi:hypothetical protein